MVDDQEHYIMSSHDITNLQTCRSQSCAYVSPRHHCLLTSSVFDSRPQTFQERCRSAMLANPVGTPPTDDEDQSQHWEWFYGWVIIFASVLYYTLKNVKPRSNWVERVLQKPMASVVQRYHKQEGDLHKSGPARCKNTQTHTQTQTYLNKRCRRTLKQALQQTKPWTHKQRG